MNTSDLARLQRLAEGAIRGSPETKPLFRNAFYKAMLDARRSLLDIRGPGGDILEAALDGLELRVKQARPAPPLTLQEEIALLKEAIALSDMQRPPPPSNTWKLWLLMLFAILFLCAIMSMSHGRLHGRI